MENRPVKQMPKVIVVAVRVVVIIMITVTVVITVWEAATTCHAPCKLTFDLLTLKVVSESRVTPVTSVPILVFLGLSVLYLGPMYATDVRQTSYVHHRLMPPYPRGGGIIIKILLSQLQRQY